MFFWNTVYIRYSSLTINTSVQPAALPPSAFQPQSFACCFLHVLQLDSVLPSGCPTCHTETHGDRHITEACLSGAVGSIAVCAAWLQWSATVGSRPRLAGSLCQVIAAYALRLNSRAGTEGSTVSSLICDGWLILGLETLSISRCLNHW